MLEIIQYNNIESLRIQWEYLYLHSPYPLTPFSSYTYYCNCIHALRWRFKGIYLTPLFFHCHENENEAIFLLIKNSATKELTTLTVYSPIDYYELLSNNTNVAFVKQSIVEILKRYEGYSIRFDSVHDDSFMYSVLKGLPSSIQNCVMIKVNTYESYYQSLSKHQRQNLRTMYNRLKNQNLSYELKEYTSNIPQNVICKCKNVFYHRRLQRIYPAMHLKSKFKIVYNTLCARIKDPQIPSYKEQNDDIVIFEFSIESTPIAYIIGMYNRQKDIFYVARLAGDKDFSQYSPGILMLNEVIKVFAAEGVTTIDLTRGDEPYKLAMGGQVHHNYSFTLDYEAIKQIL